MEANRLDEEPSRKDGGGKNLCEFESRRFRSLQLGFWHMEVSEAQELINTIGELIDDEISDSAWDAAADFFEDVKEGIIGIEETINKSNIVTEKQETALRNWETAVRKWIHDWHEPHETKLCPLK